MTNIAVVVLDTLRKDAFEQHFDWLPGVRYDNAWSTSHWTVPAHASLFTGQYASEVGVYKNAKLFDCTDRSLAERLQSAGYNTRAYSANPNISGNFQFDRGFDQFKGSWRLRQLNENVFDWDTFIAKNQSAGVGRYFDALRRCVVEDCKTLPSLKAGLALKARDLGIGLHHYDDGAKEALEFVTDATFGDREFLFMNLMEAHAPYNAPKEYQTVEPVDIMHLQATLGQLDVPKDRIRQAYEDEVRYLSDMYKRIFGILEANFDMIITLSDHGEILGEHSAWGHNYGIYPEVTKIPLCITDDRQIQSSDSPVNLQDVYQTVLHAVDICDEDSPGQSLFTEAQNERDLLTEYHGLGDRHRYTLESEGYEKVEELDVDLNGLISKKYYGYQTFFDGFIECGISPIENPRSHLEAMIKNLNKRKSNTDGEMTEATLQQLKDLGYA